MWAALSGANSGLTSDTRLQAALWSGRLAGRIAALGVRHRAHHAQAQHDQGADDHPGLGHMQRMLRRKAPPATKTKKPMT